MGGGVIHSSQKKDKFSKSFILMTTGSGSEPEVIFMTAGHRHTSSPKEMELFRKLVSLSENSVKQVLSFCAPVDTLTAEQSDLKTRNLVQVP